MTSSAFITKEWAMAEMQAGIDMNVEFVTGSWLLPSYEDNKPCKACLVGLEAFKIMGGEYKFEPDVVRFTANGLGVSLDIIIALSDGYEDARDYKDRDEQIEYYTNYHQDDEITRCYLAAFDATTEMREALEWSQEMWQEYTDED